MFTSTKIGCFAAAVFVFGPVNAPAQNAPNVSQVLMFSTINNTNVGPQFSQSSIFSPTASGTLSNALFSLYSERAAGATCSGLPADTCNVPGTYQPASPTALNSAISSSIGVALSLIPVASPASAVIKKTDPATGLEVGADSSLGPILTERGETIGKGKWFLGFSNQNFHFTQINGLSLNGLPILYKGGDPSTIKANNGLSQPASFQLGMDVRLSQSLAFITYGVTDRVDISVGLPMIHSSAAATAYNAQVFTGAGLGANGNNCWCMNTLSPGTFQTTQAFIGRSSSAKTGFGDLLLRVKGAVINHQQGVLSVGTDVRFATGDSSNYLGTGTTSVKPFVAVSLISKSTPSGIVVSPHFDIGFQFSGKSDLGGTISGTPQTANLNGQTVPFFGAPLVTTKDYLPDVLQYSIGTEFALGRRNTVVLDFVGNEIGLVHGAPTVQFTSVPGFSPMAPFAAANAAGMADGGRKSFAQYSGSFGYKVRVTGNLVATFNALVRFDDNGLTARFVPLYGVSYTF